MSEQLITTPGLFGENGNFLLERQLGDGGMGGVYMGRDKMLDRPVAVKVMLKEYGEDAEFVEKFKKEAQAAARLIHPNIAQIYSYGICDGMPYISMELVAGGSLHQLMINNPGKTDVARVMKICEQVAQALRCAADQGLVHGDVKPENILLDYNGNAKLVDFGLAAMQKDTDEIWGTPYYISPEKVRKEPVDYRADMFSLGGTLYHALTGVAPFEGDDPVAVVKKRFEGAPKKPSEIRSELSPQIDALVMRMLQLDKEERFPTFEALLDEFRNVMTSGIGSGTASAPPAARPAAKPASGGGRAALMRSRRAAMMTRKRPGAVVRKLEGEEGNEGALDSSENPAGSDEDEEEGGNLGLKVAGVVVGVILLIGAVVGGLIWYKASAKKSAEDEKSAAIVSNIKGLRGAISDTRDNSVKMADELHAKAERALEVCRKTTAELKTILPQELAAQLEIPPTRELLDAIASTNFVPAAVSAVPQSGSATNAVAAAGAATNVAAVAGSAAKVQTKAAAPAATTNAPAEKASAAAAKADKQPEAPKDLSVDRMNKLWELAYGCQACDVRFSHKMQEIFRLADESLAMTADTQETMDRLKEINNRLVGLYEELKIGSDYQTINKHLDRIVENAPKIVVAAKKDAGEKKRIADQKKREEEEAARKKAKKEAELARQKALVDSERAAAAETFVSLTDNRVFEQLDWETALSDLENLRAKMKTAEGEIAVDEEIRKVNAMKAVQDIINRNSKNGFRFKRTSMKGWELTGSDKSALVFKRGKENKRILWRTFYKKNYQQLSELILEYVCKGRRVGKPTLNLEQWAEAMSGAALTFRVICSEEASATENAEKLVKEVAKQFEDYRPQLKAMFPDVSLDADAEE